MTTAITVPFHGAELFIVERNGQPYTPMKPIVEGMGLTWQPQHRKLSENEKRWGIIKMVIPTAGDLQEMVCMPLRKLFGWLATISPNKVKPELRDTIIMYQNECDDVLWDYWTKGQVVVSPDPVTRIEHMLESIGSRYPALKSTSAYEAAMKMADDMQYKDPAEPQNYFVSFQDGKVIVRWMEPRFYMTDMVELAEIFEKFWQFSRSNDLVHHGKRRKQLQAEYEARRS